MTLYVCIQLIQEFNIDMNVVKFEVSVKASKLYGTSAYFVRKDKVVVVDLLYGLMLPSGNDAAQTLAENFGVLLYY